MKKEMHNSPGTTSTWKYSILRCVGGSGYALPFHSLLSFLMLNAWNQRASYKVQSPVTALPSRSKTIITLAWPQTVCGPVAARGWNHRRWEGRFRLSFLRRPSSPSVCGLLFFFFCVRAPLLLNGLSPLSALFSPTPNFWSFAEQPERRPQVAPMNHRSSTVREAFTFTHFCFCFFFNTGSIILQPAEVFQSCFPSFVRQSVLSMNQSQCCQLSRGTDQNLIMFSGCCCCCCALMRLYCFVWLCLWLCVCLV